MVLIPSMTYSNPVYTAELQVTDQEIYLHAHVVLSSTTRDIIIGVSPWCSLACLPFLCVWAQFDL